MGKYHQVKQGECLSSLAAKYGFVDYERLRARPENAGLLRERQNPNVLLPDDRVFIPDHELKEVDAMTEQRHVFEVKTSRTLFRLIVEDADERPYANVRYELTIGRRVFEGATDDDGRIELPIPADARDGELVLFADEAGEPTPIETVALVFGHLDPVDEITGVQSRLNNLGFGSGPVDGVLGERTQQALRAFQAKQGLETTGRICAATRDALRRLHDWQ